MSEGFAGSGGGAGDGDGGDGWGSGDATQLYAAMAQATADIGGVRVDPARMLRARRRHRLSEGGVVAGVLSVALVAATVAMYGGGGGTARVPGGTGSGVASPTVSAATAVTAVTAAPSKAVADVVVPTGVSVYDSAAGTEGGQSVHKLLSGTGAWVTNQYCQKVATSDGRPKGTGVIFDLGTPTPIAAATVDIGVPGAELEMWAADPSLHTPPAVRPGQPPAGFTKVATTDAATATTVLTPAQPVTTRYVMVWFGGALPAVPNPDISIQCAHADGDGNRYGDSISAVRFSRG
ncbi:hypothetical protein Caci_6761 [Catenulispora acidiphila DSM 44928]|uniref:Uncharacterized protein n=1 Tax=Catenulispora acidiphila (strain DSM 44928 / JCM 14897 / NBRC 102108 / NRRL B-24433 / ID139908) TaxID=479433 RepID=C7Q1Q5_CATAD|nr:hypothetical protein [Catenulispora acidiphila]ACU75606.1 hypothetical protein Caci_6761 [Catenulispora acidiphila DSM 44928]